MTSPLDAGPVPLRHLRGGAAIPALGFGTWDLGDACGSAVRCALDTGYRHLDTARAYENERQVGQALADSGLPREAVWITSKAWCHDLSPASVVRQAEQSLRELRVDCLDLFLIHWPNPDFPLGPTLEAFQQLVAAEKIRHFGVSNFTPRLWQEAIALAPEILTNQVEYHPLLDQSELIRLAAEHDACLTAYSPLARGQLFKPDTSSARLLQDIASSHGKTPHQIVLRWLIEQPEVVAIPASTNPAHIAANFDLFDFNLTPDQRRAIAALNQNRRLVHPEWAPPEW